MADYMEQYKTDHISVCGYSHQLTEKECQDHSDGWQTKKYAAIIVCDGHGGEKYIRSATGSLLACEVGREMLDAFMAAVVEKKISLNEKTADDVLHRLECSVIQRWRIRVEEDALRCPPEEDRRFSDLQESDRESLRKNPVKAYGTTFLAAVLTQEFCFVLKLGDGNASVLYPNGTVELPAELKGDRWAFNVTTSMCNSDADLQFRHQFIRFSDHRPVTGLMLTSDGVINCYRSEEAFRSLVRNIFLAYSEQQRKDAREELEDLLHTLSEKGSGDDLSVALICGKRPPRNK